MPDFINVSEFASVSQDVATSHSSPSALGVATGITPGGRKFYKFEKNGKVTAVSENERSSLSKVAKAATQSEELMQKSLRSAVSSREEDEKRTTTPLDRLITEAKQIRQGLDIVSKDVEAKIAKLKENATKEGASFGDKVKYQLHLLRNTLYKIFNSVTPEKIIETNKQRIDEFIKEAEWQKELKKAGPAARAVPKEPTTESDRKFKADANETLRRFGESLKGVTAEELEADYKRILEKIRISDDKVFPPNYGKKLIIMNLNIAHSDWDNRKKEEIASAAAELKEFAATVSTSSRTERTERTSDEQSLGGMTNEEFYEGVNNELARNGIEFRIDRAEIEEDLETNFQTLRREISSKITDLRDENDIHPDIRKYDNALKFIDNLHKAWRA